MDQKPDFKRFHDDISKRRIEWLIHFTTTENLSSIIQYGALLSRTRVNELNIEIQDLLDFIQFPDDYRFDNLEDYINLSIQRPNRYLLDRFMQKLASHPDIHWCILKIQPHHIYARPTLFSVTNAASNAAKNKFGISGDFDKFTSLFQNELTISTSSGTRTFNRNGIPDNYTTDIQAEVLVKNAILYEDIINICFRDEETLNNTRSAFNIMGLDTTKFIVDKDIF
ncbi:DarT ssDNA thymidine ADP-ribosyltransferase family protein [Nitrosomonas sp.]|uniref:DarT ssDNA thymidine ADP-ribosyltransferase family protein n=1 Tax=Nitrosomonas sp. TaxID=42353 RepID=UPI001DF6B988|nr:DarT ssDNA thymidine ADP-ribosyltransferase family protein [Nitrosomonas sp.]MCB1948380.1 DUF4433 domain-containing protein [Nitrosomonas sp.]